MKRMGIEKFSAGLDTRPGTYGRDSDRYRELTNGMITADGDTAQRFPCANWTGVLGAECQGLILLNGQWFTLVPRGTAVTSTGEVATNVTALEFDPPEYATGTWTLLDAAIFQNVVCTVIRHGYESAVVPSRILLHVFDGGGT
jgi:hypothetical protein